MTEGVSLTGLNVSIFSAGVSIKPTSTGLAVITVSLIGTVSATGNTTGSTGSFLLLSDGTSFLLLADGASKLQLAGPQ